MENNNYEQMAVSSLKNLARERCLRGHYKLRKSELVKQIRNPPPLEHTRAHLLQLARERGLRRYSTFRKSELLQRLRGSGDQILDRDIDARMENVPILTPTPYVPQQQATPAPSLSSNDFEDLTDYSNKATERPEIKYSSRNKFIREKNVYMTGKIIIIFSF